jgi:hypothetical protein
MVKTSAFHFGLVLSWFHFSSPLASTLIVHNDCCKPYFCT